MSDPWAPLEAELDRWPRPPTLWWRDDDAVAWTPELARLLDAAAGIPVHLAVIPARLDDGLPRRLAGRETIVLQHGWRHQNHAAPGAKRAELGPERPAEIRLAELALGHARLAGAFGAAFRPALVPPWNRIDPALIGRLERWSGLSAFRPRPAATADGLAVVNAHVDPIDWRGGRGFVGPAAALAALAGHLAARRTGAADPDEPTGLLTHHLAQDAALWAWLAELPRRLAGRVAWTRPFDAIAPSRAAARSFME